MNAQERKAALQNIYTLSGYYNFIGGILAIDQWGGLPEEGVSYCVKVNSFLDSQRRALYFTPETDELAAHFKEHPIGESDIETAFIENFIGRSRAYIHHIYPNLIQAFPAYADISEEDFYRGFNKVASTRK